MIVSNLAFTCRSCRHTPMRIEVDRPGITQTVLKLFCPECGATFRPTLSYETANLELAEDVKSDV